MLWKVHLLPKIFPSDCVLIQAFCYCRRRSWSSWCSSCPRSVQTQRIRGLPLPPQRHGHGIDSCSWRQSTRPDLCAVVTGVGVWCRGRRGVVLVVHVVASSPEHRVRINLSERVRNFHFLLVQNYFCFSALSILGNCDAVVKAWTAQRRILSITFSTNLDGLCP